MTANIAKTQSAVRPPIIVIMGHIDHGKSTLLDYIRKSNIVAGESGGITQHISAYEVVHKGKDGADRKITFIDTPGHEAFSAMRERGACIGDIGILIVSAEEGVKAQTKEAYKSIVEAKIPYIVAINKIDRPNANVEKCKQELAEAGVLVEGYGGDVPFVPISAKTGEGVDDLLDMMLLVAEMQEFKGDPSAPASGYVLESNLDPKSGVTATLMIKNGVLKTGDFAIVGREAAKIKKIEDFLGQTIKEATFSAPVRVYGFAKIPSAGSEFIALADKKEAETLAANYKEGAHTNVAGPKVGATQIVVPIFVKADVAGTLEALEKEIAKTATDKIVPKIIQTGVGQITENDIRLASGSSGSLVLGFHTKVERAATDMAERFGITIVTFDIIYKLSEWLAEKFVELTPKEKIEETIGKAKVLKLFSQNKDKQILGGTVLSGKILKGREVKIMRRDSEVGRGKITDLQEQKIKTGQVEEGQQFGAEVDSKITIAAGDTLEAFDVVLK